MNQGNSHIKALELFYKTYNVKIEINLNDFFSGNTDVVAVKLSINNHTFNFYIDDEYSDFKINNPILNLCVILRDLEDCKTTSDFEVWCLERHIEPNGKMKAYFDKLPQIIKKLESVVGEIKSEIPAFDFEFSCGAVQILRND